MNKKILICFAAVLAVVLIALCIFLIVAQPGASDTPTETTTTDSISESATTDGTSNVTDPIEGSKENVSQPDTDIADNEISIDDLLNPNIGIDDVPEQGDSGENTSPNETTEETEPSDTPEMSPDVTEDETTEPEATESMLPDATQDPDDGYSNNWY